ncbi:PD-(D/E)XK nuclease-like domain-containing protein [Paenibacillus pinisoli]|uniref:PD-(D/E)XK nuclease-like domain-containing protein n=1 Tax=Paenibacillus pinisoli TaxID=1276110 RepID=UPI003C7326B1
MQLDNLNYHSREANAFYLSHSQYQDFRTCEASAMAKIRGEWSEPESEALKVGSYVHSWAEGVLDQFHADHPEIFLTKGSNKGELRAPYQVAERMISALRDDEFCMFVLSGDKEVIITAKFAGAIWKAKIDVHNPQQGRFTDLKTTQDIRKRHWDRRWGWVSFVVAYNYTTQLSLYAELDKRRFKRENWLEPLLLAVTKEEIPDKEIIAIDNLTIERELEEIENNMPRILEVKHGGALPSRCERCDYCKSTKKLRSIIHYSNLLEGV